MENLVHRYFAGLNEKMDMVGHQAISEDLIIANRLILPKNCQKLAVIIIIFKDSLFADTAINDMIDTERTEFAWTR